MAVLLLILSFINIFLFFLFSYKDKDSVFTNLRIAFIKSSLVVSSIVVIFTEVLSVFRVLTPVSIVISWACIFIVSLIILIFFYKKWNSSFRELQSNKVVNFLKNEPLVTKVIIALLSLIIISLFCVAFTTNNNWDSYTYHLPKVEHWIQDKNVDFFPTNNIRQLYLAPFAEYFILNIRLLSGSAFFINFVQFFSWFNCFLLASLIAKSLGLLKRGQLLSLILALTIPMALLQSTTTQTDLVVSFFLVSFIYFGISIIKYKTITFESVLFLCLSFSLGILTKSTFYIFAFPFCLMFGIYYLRLFKIKALYILASIILVFFLFNTPFLYRNYIQFGSPLGPQKTSLLSLPNLNENFGFKETLSNSVKNIGLHLALPNNSWNNGVDRLIERIHQIIDFPLNSTTTSWFGTAYKTNFVSHHDVIGNFLQLVMFFISIIILFLIKFKSNSKLIIAYFLSLILGFLFFDFLLKWQPWQTRLDLPIFFLLAPFTAYEISLIKWKSINIVVGLLFLLVSIGALSVIFTYDPVKPIFGKDSAFLKNNTSYILGYDSAVKIESKLKEYNISNVGLILGSDSWEWQYWLLSKNRRFEHVYFSKDLKRTENFNLNFNYRALIISNFYLEDKQVSNLINDKSNTSEIFKIDENETLVILKTEQNKSVIY